MRIVSLLASGTEIVCGLGAGDALVGRSHECDNPEWVKRLPCCTQPAFDIEMASGEIDAEVRRRLRAGEPLYHVDAELINRLEPDVLISQEHCDVCAVTPNDIARTGCASVARQVIALSAGTLAGIYDGVRAVGQAIGREAAAADLIADMQSRIEQVSAAVAHKRAPTVVMLEWTDPIFAMGNWGPELVEAANGNLLLGEKGEFSRAIDWDAVRAADPEYLIIAPCGYGLERSLRETSVLEALPGWFELKAVQTGKVAFADGNKFFNRSGTTIVETTEITAEILHGFDSPESWRDKAWQQYSPSDQRRSLV
ncbi:MAG: ABC transporter substrate-binding protein [Chthoniobacterales bacterium]|nr:ABC transporter substrate-binding protein [Chthoniobacterales bacterium]MDQ3421661.1 ABC transporter substrate-binding protein [Acidobacteriota bacterium]